jgi:hypothetical protein
MDLTYWTYIGTFYLLVMTFQDHKNNRMIVNGKYNYIALGLSLSLISHIERSFFFMLIAIVLLFFLYKYANGFNIIGQGDILSLNWILLGYFIINPAISFMFFVIFSLLTGIYHLGIFIGKKILKIEQKLRFPFFIVILLSYFLTNIIFNLY